MKKIEDCYIEISKLKYEFGNPRKTKKVKEEIDELKKSIEQFGSWRSIGIDEYNNVIFGNKLSMALKELGIQKTSAKRLIGYTKNELKAINIKDNEHVGEFDIELLSDWVSDIQKEINDFEINIPVLEKIDIELNPVDTSNTKGRIKAWVSNSSLISLHNIMIKIEKTDDVTSIRNFAENITEIEKDKIYNIIMGGINEILFNRAKESK